MYNIAVEHSGIASKSRAPTTARDTSLLGLSLTFVGPEKE